MCINTDRLYYNSLLVCRGLNKLAAILPQSQPCRVSLHIGAKVQIHSKAGNRAFQLMCIWLYGIENWKIKGLSSSLVD